MEDDIDYDAENDYNEDEPIEGDDLVDEIENLFLNAKSSDNPIEAYLNVIELETQNSDQKTFSFRSYKEICIIHMKNNSYDKFCESLKKLIEISKKVPDNYKQGIFGEAFLPVIEENDFIDYTPFLKALLKESEKALLNSLNQEVENFVNNSKQYKGKFIEEKKTQTFSFDKLIVEYYQFKNNVGQISFYENLNNLSKEEQKCYKLRQYESMSINKQIPLIKESVKTWKNENSRKFWSEWVEDYEKFSDLPIFYNEISKVEICKVIGFNILINLYDTKDSVQNIGFNASMYLFDILSRIFCNYNDADLREYVVTSGMFSYILKRLEILTEEIPRKYLPDKRKKIEEDKETKKKEIDYDKVFSYTQKSKGIGYSRDVSNKVWDVDAYLEKQKKHRNFLIESIISFFVKYFNMTNLKEEILNEMYRLILESALLPCLENLFTENSILELTKNAKLVNLYFQLIENFSKSSVFVLLLKDISPDYKPIQTKNIFDLSKDLINSISIYNKQKMKQNLETNVFFDDILIYFKEIEKNMEFFDKQSNMYQTTVKIIHINNMDPVQAYPLLLKKYVFDYISMTNSSKQIDHYFAKNTGFNNMSYNYNYDNKTNNNKTYTSEEKVLRLLGEFSNLQTSLPIEFTNSIFVRVDKDNMDYMKAIIFGSEGTPYSSGAFTYDIYFGSDYPNSPPNVVITSTGNGTVRFNPNLYNTGKVCLSLLGTWRGTQGENWDPKISTIYQVLLSIQSIIMSDLVYFNEPGHESQLGTPEGDKLNEGYSNIVRYNNIRVCMIDMIKNPPKGFEDVIKIHFYLKKEKILKEVDTWIEKAKNKPYIFDGLSNGHNSSYASRFKNKNDYYKDLVKIREELKNVLYSIKLDNSLLSQKIVEKKKEIKNVQTEKMQEDIQFDEINDIDMSYDTNANNGNNVAKMNEDIAKDRYSRYIGAMGMDAVQDQSNANIFISGAGPLGIEIAKNIVLSGCKELVLHDTKNTSLYDLSGQFFLGEKDIGFNRAERCIQKLQQLNYYVKISLNKDNIFKKNLTEKDIEKLGFKKFTVIILTECDNDTIIIFDKFCRKNNIYLIICDVYGCVGRIINDFGNNFKIKDKDGESIKECYIKNIEILYDKESPDNIKAIITNIDKAKHGFQDGDLIEFIDFTDDCYKIINQKKFLIKVISSTEFEINDNTGILKNIKNNDIKTSDKYLGKCRQVKQMSNIGFNSIEELLNVKISNETIDKFYDKNLSYIDFSKINTKYAITRSFNIINELKKANKNYMPYDLKIIEYIKDLCKKNSYDLNDVQTLNLICGLYMYQFPTLSAFFGGIAAQEAIKSITKKFTPICQYMTFDCLELLSDIKMDNKYEIKNKNDILKIVLGEKAYKKLVDTNLLLVGAGAIGCELLKNYAMLGLSTGEKGKIFITDPDIIEVSNLTRQFLFREKHLRLPKSSTAAAAVIQMNPELKGHIFSKNEKVCEETEYLFNDNFFKKLTIVTNALDNVNARKYVDLRCTNNRICLLESGTLGTKGHVQVIIPFKTENYSSQNDPDNSNDEIPQCTLKMFPEEAIHCLEWARDQLGKNFTQFPRNFNRIIENIKNNNFNKEEFKAMKTCLKWLKKMPKNFNDCIKLAKEKYYKVFISNIKKLLITYPVDKKDKDGNLFWSLPKRPPKIIDFDIKNNLCKDFISAYSCLLANLFNIKNIYKNPRDESSKIDIIKISNDIKIVVKDNFEINNKIIEEENTNKKEQKENESTFDDIEFTKIKDELIAYTSKIGIKNIPKLTSVEFEKDNDSNYQIDLIYSMSGLRCLNYNIEPFDWITCKLKAGKIIPALATTTSCISALQSLELLKIIKELDVSKNRNTFLNLAIPYIQNSEPGEVVTKKITDKLSSNIWDIWEIDVNKNLKKENCIQFLFDELYKKYNIFPKDIFLGKKPVFSSMLYKGKDKEKDDFMKNEQLTNLLEYDEYLLINYVDVIVTFTAKKDTEEYLKNIPRVRINFK